MQTLRQIDDWAADHAAAAVVAAEGVVASYGRVDHVFRWASVTKPATALATLVAAEEGALDLDEPAGPPGATVRHLLAHTSGLPFDPGSTLARPGERRIYSNHGFEVLAEHVAAQTEIPFPEYLQEAAFAPLGMGAELRGSAGSHVYGSLDDLVRLARELLRPTLVAHETLAEATAVAFPGLGGVLPGFGRFDPLDWGLGFELKGGKPEHWSGSRTSARTFGHFGGSGTFLWVDPERELALACLTDREFDRWAKTAWPALSDAVLEELE
ncbi:MAG: beta-lactamase family protein [Actinobacteria bacterium]|nr:beta-lactamase family protein [Actinomycetota bacterium]